MFAAVALGGARFDSCTKCAKAWLQRCHRSHAVGAVLGCEDGKGGGVVVVVVVSDIMVGPLALALDLPLSLPSS